MGADPLPSAGGHPLETPIPEPPIDAWGARHPLRAQGGVENGEGRGARCGVLARRFLSRCEREAREPRRCKQRHEAMTSSAHFSKEKARGV